MRILIAGAGVLRDGTADYARIRRQPTALPATSDPRLAELERALRQRGFAVQRVTDMDGWLALPRRLRGLSHRRALPLRQRPGPAGG